MGTRFNNDNIDIPRNTRNKAVEVMDKIDPILGKKGRIIPDPIDHLDLNHPLEAQIASILKQQSNKPREKQRIYTPIKLNDLSAYSQPRKVYDSVKSQFKNADWQPNR